MTKLEEIARAILAKVMCDYCQSYGGALNPDCCAVEAARAAVEAMREPTDEMAKAAWDAQIEIVDEVVRESTAREVWRVMIDAILNEKQD